jgi:hypothetical protein
MPQNRLANPRHQAARAFLRAAKGLRQAAMRQSQAAKGLCGLALASRSVVLFRRSVVLLWRSVTEEFCQAVLRRARGLSGRGSRSRGQGTAPPRTRPLPPPSLQLGGRRDRNKQPDRQGGLRPSFLVYVRRAQALPDGRAAYSATNDRSG